MDELTVPSFIQPGASLPIEEKRVGFGRRLGAYLIDVVIVILIGVIGVMALSSILDPYIEETMQKQLAEIPNADEIPEFGLSMMRWGISMSVVAGVVGIALSFLELFMGASIGKLLLGVRIAHADGRAGTMVLWGQRWFVKYAASILSLIGTLASIRALSTASGWILIVFFIGCFFALGSKRQALHDMLVKSAVFRNEDIIA